MSFSTISFAAPSSSMSSPPDLLSKSILKQMRCIKFLDFFLLKDFNFKWRNQLLGVESLERRQAQTLNTSVPNLVVGLSTGGLFHQLDLGASCGWVLWILHSTMISRRHFASSKCQNIHGMYLFFTTNISTCPFFTLLEHCMVISISLSALHSVF